MDSAGSSPALEIRHKTQQSHDSGAYLDWSSEDSASPTGNDSFNVSGEFVTVVAVGAGKADAVRDLDASTAASGPEPASDVPFVTVLAIGTASEGKAEGQEESTTVSLNVGEDVTEVATIEGDMQEDVLVYRLPGERLGFGLKFEGGIKSAERVKRLFIQSCAQDSPASRARCTWGTLEEGDELIEIDGEPVNTMTRIDCVRCLKESNVVIKLFVRHQMADMTHTLDTTDARRKLGLELKATQSMPLASNDQSFSPLSPAKSTGDLPLVISAEMKKCLPQPSMPPPIPPRKVPRKPASSKDVTTSSIVGPPSGFCDGQSPKAAVRTSLQHDTPMRHDVEYRSAPTTPRVRQRLPPASPRVEARHSYQSSPEVSRHMGKRLSGFNMSAVPPEAEVYLDLLALEEMNRFRNESESDDTGSSLSTVVDRFSTTNSSFSDLRSSASSTCDLTTPSTPTSTSTPSIDLAKVLGPFEQLEREFSSNSRIDDDFLLTKLVASEESFSKLQTNKGVSAEQVSILLAASSRTSEDDSVTLQPPPNFQDYPLINCQELSYALTKPTANYNNVQLPDAVDAQGGEDIIQLKSRTPVESSAGKEGDLPALPPKPVPRKGESSRFRSGKKRPPPPPPPRNDRPQCPKPSQTAAAEESADDEAPLVDVDLSEPSQQPPQAPVAPDELEIIERYPVSGSYLPRLVDVMPKGQIILTHALDTKLNGVEEDGKTDEDDEPISLDFSVLDQTEDICITVPQLCLGSSPSECTMSAADLEDTPVVAVAAEDGSAAPTLEVDEARILEDDATHSAEFQITAVTCASDVFFPYHWSVTSHLATIGEVEEDEAPEPTSSSSLCDVDTVSSGDANASPRETEELVGVLGSGALHRPINEPVEYATTMEDSDDDESKSGRSSSTAKEPISEENGDAKGFQSDAQHRKLQNERGLDATVTRSKRKEKPRNGDVLEEPVKPREITLIKGHRQLAGDDHQITKVATDVNPSADSIDKGVRGTMDALLALDSLTASTTLATKAPPSIAYPPPQSSPSEASLSPPPSFSRLPPDGHEFPPNYQEPNHFSVGIMAHIEMDLNMPEKVPVDTILTKPSNDFSPPPLPVSAPPQKKQTHYSEGNANLAPVRKFSSSSTSSGPDDGPPRPRPPAWRKDEKSEKSVRDKIAMFASQEDSSLPQPVQNGARRLSSHSFKSSENIFYDDDMVDCSSGSLPSGKVLSRSIVSVDKISQSNNSYSYRQPSKSTSLVSQSYKGFAPYGSTGDVSFISAPASERNDESSRSLEYTTRTLSSVDLTSPSSYNHSSIDSTHSSNPHSYGYSSTLPRKMNSNRQTPAPSPFATLQRKHGTMEPPRISNTTAGNDHLHSRSQSLIDVVSAARPARHSISHDGSKCSTEETRRASLNALVEQRRRSMSKLRGLVIPEKVSEVSSNHTIFDLPEIKSRDSILATKPPLLTKDDPRFVNNQQSQPTHNWVSKNNSYTTFEKPALTNVPLSANLITPPWKCQTPASNLPKYSPAFKRKSLAVCGSSSASSVSSSLNSSREELRPPSESRGKKSPLPPTKPPRNSTSMSNNLHSRNHSPSNYTAPFVYNPEPPKSLESLTSPTRSDSSFDYILDSSPDLSISKNDIIKSNDSILNDNHKQISLNHNIKSMSDTGRSGEDDSDNDSAVSSSRSSISHEFSPPQSPIPDSTSRDNQHHTTRQHILLSPLPSSGSGNDRRPLRRTLSSETTASVASSTASTLTSGSQASCSSNGGSSSDSNSKRVLKPKSVEAINRKNVLSSARYSSGRDLKVGSPLIQRKFEDEEERSDADDGEDETLHDDSDLDQSTSGGEMEQSKDLMYYSSYTTPDEVHENEVKIAYLNIQNPDHDFDTLEDSHEEIDRIVSKVMLVEEMKENAVLSAPKAAPRRTNVSTHELIPTYETNGRKHTSEGVPLPVAIEDEVDCSDKLENQAQNQAITFDVKNTKVSNQENGQLNGNDHRKISPTINGHGLNGNSPSSVEHSKPIQRKNSNRLLSEAAPEAKSTENDLLNLLQGTQCVQRQKSNDERQKKNDDTSRPPPATAKHTEVLSPPAISRIPTTTARIASNRRSVSVNDIRKAFEKAELALNSSGRASNGNKAVNGSSGFINNHHARVSSLDSTTSEDNYAMQPLQYGSVSNLQREQYGSITSLASTTSLISQQELQVLIDEANQTLEELGGGSPPVHEVLVVVLHREVVGGSVGITLAGGADYEAKEITVHKVLGGSPADRDGRIQKGDRILSINGKSMKGVTHRESQNILKTPRSEVILVISRPRPESMDCSAVTSSSARPPRILEQLLEGETMNGLGEVARGPPVMVVLPKEGAGLGFSLEGGKDSPLGDKPLIIKKIFMGGSADKSGQLQAGDELLKVNESDLSAMTRIEAWGLMKKLPDGKVSLTVRHAVENKPC